MLNIHKITVLGLGTMGHGIAQSFAAKGFQVSGFDELDSVRNTVKERIRANIHSAVTVGFGDKSSIDSILSNFRICESEAEALQDSDFVVEAVKEDLELKQQLFGRIEPLVSRNTIIASNTSSFPITQLSAHLNFPDRTIVTHWFNPPHIVPVVEVVPGEKTSLFTIDRTLDLLKKAGKSPIRLKKEIPGFLINRIQIAMLREILDLLNSGVADASEIDRAVKGSIGLRLAAIGPLEVIDFAGLETTGKVFQSLVGDIKSDQELPAILKEKIDLGHFGVKTGNGIYKYTDELINEKIARRDHCFLELLKLLYEGKTDLFNN